MPSGTTPRRRRSPRPGPPRPRRPSTASVAARAAGSANPSVATPLGTRHSRGATDCHAAASGTSSASRVPAGVSSRAISTTRRRASPGPGAAAPRPRLRRSSAATSQSARARPRSRGASSSMTSAISPTTPLPGARPTRASGTPAGQTPGLTSTGSTPTTIKRSLCASNGCSAASRPRTSGCGSGNAPLPFGVVRTGAGTDSASARSHLASSGPVSRPATSTGRAARAIESASASSASAAGAGTGARRHAVTTGSAGASATPAGTTR